MPLVDGLDRPFPDAKWLALDIETQGLKFWQDRPVMLQLSDGSDAISLDVRPYIADDVYADIFSNWLRDHVYDRGIIVHNGLFDLTYLKYWFGADYPARIWDTKLAEQLRYCGLPVSSSLKDVAEREFGRALDKTQQLSFLEENGFDFETSEIRPEQVEYGDWDVLLLPALREKQIAALKAEDMMYVAGIEMDALPVFCEMRLRGVKVDVDRLRPLLDKAREERDQIEIELQELLTPYIYFERMAKYKHEIRPRVAYKRQIRQLTEDLRHGWQYVMDNFDTYSDEYRQEWMDAKYDDLSPHDKQPWTKGCQRFITAGLKEFRAEHGGMPGKPNFSPFDPINLNSPQQLMTALSNVGLVLKDTSKGVLKAALGEEEDDTKRQILQKILDFRKREKMLGSFGDSLIAHLDEHSRVHGDYNQIISTGRHSSYEPNQLNMPNAPEYRACFVADEDKKLVVADYSQIEYRIMAELAGEQKIIDAYQEGADFHTRTAASIFQVPEDAVTKEQRSVAKIFNFGINYGMKENTLRANMAEQQIYVTKQQAKEWVDRYNRQYSKVERFREQQGRLALKRGYAMTPFGRRRYFELDKIENQWDRFSIMRRAGNMPIQGGNADIMKIAMAVVQDAVKPYGASVVLQIYDELVVETPQEHAEEVAQLVIAGMQAAAELLLSKIPVEVDSVISPSWSEAEGTEVV